MRRIILRLIALVLLISWVLWGCALEQKPGGGSASTPSPWVAAAWPQADALFHRDPRWRGADDAYSVDLGKGRVLWLFGDSLITDPPGIGRPQATLIRNSIAIQEGYDPSRATMRFHWRAVRERPAAFFPMARDTWLWPGDGERLGDQLLLFFMEIGEADNPLGFELVGWRALHIVNPDAPPTKWQMQWLSVPANGFRAIVGSGSVFVENGHLFALAYQEQTRDVLLARWPVSDAREANLTPIQWWCGPRHGWRTQQGLEIFPAPLFANGQAELTVHRDALSKGYMAVQSVGFGPAHVALRQAPHLTGPWSAPVALHQPDEQNIADVMIYAAKAHPHLQGADLVLTYCTNSFVYENVLVDKRLYYPRFVRLTRRP